MRQSGDLTKAAATHKPPRPILWVATLLTLLSALRLWTAARVGLGDAEAYYWTWSEQLSTGYLDHGPVVAWLIKLGTSIVGDRFSTLGVRLPFVLISALTLALVGWRAAAWHRSANAAAWQHSANAAAWQRSANAAAWSILAIALMPAFLIAGGAANPDVPFVFLCTCSLAAAQLSIRAANREASPGRNELVWLAIAAACAGLSVNAKLFGLALIVPLCWLVLRPCEETRRSIWKPSPSRWAKSLCVWLPFVICASPYLYWNATHGFASFVYHLHARHGTAPVGLSLVNLGKLVGGQLAYVSPFILLALLLTAARLSRGVGMFGRDRDKAIAPSPAPIADLQHLQPHRVALLLYALSILIPGYVLIAITPTAEPHWPIAGYIPLAISLGAEQIPAWLAGGHGRMVRVLAATTVSLALLVFVAFHVHVLSPVGVRLMPASYESRYDLGNELTGWPAVADTIVTLNIRQREGSPGGPAVVIGCHYTVCAQLTFAARGRFSVACPSPRVDQFDFAAGGDGSRSIVGRDVLYVEDNRFPFEASALYRCRRAQNLQTVFIRRGGRIVRRFDLTLCEGFDGLESARWPPGAPRYQKLTD